ncbi:MAG: class I SAM-dependent methyltransferase [Nanoarchaeota archaeon]|nr:class I SAM-dependent methyltransferase [Nanoarchaeota archaeon]
MGKHNESIAVEYVKCNLCNSDSTRIFMKVDGFNIVKCKNCDLIYVNPRLKFNELEKIYKNKIYFNNQSFKDTNYTFYGYENYLLEKKDIIYTFIRRLNVIEKYKKPGTLLDIGCALGFFLELALKRGWKARGIEISKVAAGYAKKHQKSPVFNGTLEEVNYKKESFDVITIFDVIEHVPNPKKTILQIKNLLKPGGIISITTPNIGSLPAKILGKKWEEVRRVREHIYYFSDKTLNRLLKESGFKILKIESAGRYFSVESAVRRLNIYSSTLSGISSKFTRILGINNMRIYIDPYYKITVYARKI